MICQSGLTAGFRNSTYPIYIVPLDMPINGKIKPRVDHKTELMQEKKKIRLNIHFNSVTYCGGCMPTRHRREKPISGWLLEELLSVMRVHGAPHTHQLMLIQPGSRHLLLASALLIINPFLHTSSEPKNSLTVSLQTSRQRAGCEGF